MPSLIHVEKHFKANDTVRDVVIGMSDGLTVPFALAAGLTGAIAASSIVITAGLAEIAAGSIAMGLGGYLAAKSDYEHYFSEKKREEYEVKELPDAEREEVAVVFRDYGFPEEEIKLILDRFEKNPKSWVDFMMKYELGLEEPDKKRGLKSALTIALSYIVGGMIPLSPYFFVAQAKDGLVISIVMTMVALLIFGFIKGKFTGAKPLISAIQTVVIGGMAATAAFLLAKFIG
ncbi:MAG TPA: VIT1/CCC1 transporter family protein [Ignavibacteriaceae bacterium]|jgi:VIT1/CCC1 family predicted Fe2+/Mn2+ transporter|nr:MAG: VIT family protein [Ignavibacteria bacterium ADurb.Bin266]OQY69684.1 MAG: iron transporter [Ignavibacteriales bacterium UTCHB2]HQF42700.1 VIT1/CCC1 transporter family protein [Ignavibacteriaceae bacterium]HQI42094.1 VIT1/CCC1 transporter family protein [Ignavibacteriaceae bacterium]HQJ46149.1 VIT1/CCC1 transporter family protein [Ignavibacteriaceae bacterium]